MSQKTNKIMTLVDALENSASSSRISAYHFLSTDLEIKNVINYEELHLKARAIAYELQRRNVKKGERAILIFEPGIDFVLAFMACQLIGVIAVPCYPPANIKLTIKMKNIISICQPSVILSTQSIEKRIRQLSLLKWVKHVPVISKAYHKLNENFKVISDMSLRQYPWIAIDNVNNEQEAKFRSVQIDPTDISFLQFTSGSTAEPKGVIVRHENIIHNIKMISESVQINPDDVVISWLPPYHDMGLIGGLLTPLVKNIPVYTLSPVDFIKNVPVWLKAITQFKGTLSPAPNFAYNLCNQKINDETLAELDLSSWRAALNGAEPIQRKTIDEFVKKFSACGFSKEAFFPCYGLAESTLFVSGRYGIGINETVKEKHAVISCGYLPSENKVIVIDPLTEERVCSDCIGEICINSQSVTSGYWNNQTDSPRLTHQFYLRTGDLGFISDNQLYITGRIKDLIIINGINFYPHDIEEVLTHSESLKLKACAAYGSQHYENYEKLHLVIETEKMAATEYESMIQIINELLFSHFQLNAERIYFVARSSILKTTSGKLQRRATKSAIEHDEIEVYYQHVQRAK